MKKYMLLAALLAATGVLKAEAIVTKVESPTIAASVEQAYLVSEGDSLVNPQKPVANKVFEKITLTAYSSSVDETDDTPFITASGTRTRDGVVAANFLPFGTNIRIPEIFGNQVFIVEDRMHRRFSDRVDIWLPDKRSALLFGIQEVTIEVL